MGLPIWRDPEEEVARRDAARKDPTAAARSSIRRRPSVHGRRPRMPRESSHRPANDAPPPHRASARAREWRRSERRGVPPVSTLLESADRRSTLPPLPPTVPAELQEVEARNRQLENDIAQLTQMQGRASRLIWEAGASRSGRDETLPDDWAEWDRDERQEWIESRRGAQWTRSPSPINLLAADSAPARSRETDRHRVRRGISPRMPASRRPGLRDSSLPRERALPTPPHDTVEDSESLFMTEQPRDHTRDVNRPSHPLRRSWHPDSPIDGLGDRIRSPTPADGWEIMRSTIAPDETLPSAESSFTSAVASHSFGSGGTNITVPEEYNSPHSSRRDLQELGNQSDSVSISSVDPDDLACNEEEREATAAFALDMYFYELGSSDGNERVARHRAARATEGNRYALSSEPELVEVGFRLIKEALDTPEGRTRVFQLYNNRQGPGPEHRDFEDWIFAHRRNGTRRTRGARVTDDEPPSPHPERYSGSARAAASHVRGQINDYFVRRFTADAMTGTDSSLRASTMGSPPPRYERLASYPDEDTITSIDAPVAHPVSPPSSRSNQREVADSLLSYDEQDFDGVRRIVEGLAQRADIPDDWWTSVGLARHLTESRSRVRSRSPDRRSLLSPDGDRLRSGRIERQSRSPRL